MGEKEVEAMKQAKSLVDLETKLAKVTKTKKVDRFRFSFFLICSDIVDVIIVITIVYSRLPPFSPSSLIPALYT